MCVLALLSPVSSVIARTPIPTGYEVPADEVEIGPNVVHYTYTTKKISEEEELKDVQVPIPRVLRLLNTKGQCVYSSMSVLARYAKIKKLYYICNDVDDPVHPGDARCQSGSSPTPTRKVLDSYNVKYDMITNYDYNFFKKYVQQQRRGAAFDVVGHMMNIVHFSEEEGIVKVIDNADWSLSVQTWSMAKFKKVWRGWAYVVFAEDDIVPYYYDPYVNLGIDNNGNILYRKEYFPIPKKKLTWLD